MAQLFVEIGAKISGFQRQLTKIERRVNRFSRNMERLGTNLTQSVTLPLVGLGTASVATFAQFDKLEKGLGAIAGSADEGKRQLNDLLEVVKDVRTTIDLKDAATGSLQLQAVGLSADRAKESLRQLAIAATVSGGSSGDVAEVARQLAQAAAKGNILQQELRIILERIPALAGVIKNEFGTVTAEGLRDAGVSADEFISRLTKAIAENEKFANVQASLSKEIETFKINLQLAGKELGQSIANALNLQENLGRLSSTISSLVERFKNLSPETQSFIVKAALAAAAAGPLLLALGKLASIIPALITAVGAITSAFAFLVTPLGLAAVAVGALVAALIEVRINSDRWARSQAAANGTLFETNRATKALADVNAQASKKIAGQISVVENLVRVAQDESAATTVRTDALRKLKNEYPDYFGQVSEDLSKTASLTIAKNRLTDALLRQAKAQAAQARITELENEKLDIQDQIVAEQARKQEILNKLREQGFGSIQAAVQKSLQNRDLIAQQAAGTRGVNANLLNQSKSLADLVGQYQTANSVIENANLSLNDLANTQRRLAEQAASGAVPVVSAPVVSGVSTPTATVAALTEEQKKAAALRAQVDAITASFRNVANTGQLATKNLIPESLTPVTQEVADNVNRLSGSLAGLGINAESMIVVQERMTSLYEEMQPLTQLLEGPIQQGFEGFFTTLIEGGQNAFGGFIKSLKTLIVQLTAAVTTAAALALILNAITGGAAGGFGGVFKSLIGGGSLGGIFKLIPGFAEGGIVPPGYPNDSYFARLSSGEAVIPLNKINQYGGGAVNVTGEFRLQGNDLVAAVVRNQQNRERTRGR
ncbi:MAG: tape measure protein [Phaeodactylibacter sp.]|nr:tape measure protein [Phaeodactylibacter sp.]